MKLVLDTNVVLDWLVFEAPVLHPLREGIRAGSVTVVTHQPAFDELRHVIGRRRLGLDSEAQSRVISQYEALTARFPEGSGAASVPAELPLRFPRCRDPDNDSFLQLAFHSKADALASRDKQVLALRKRTRAFGFQIVSVEELTETLLR